MNRENYYPKPVIPFWKTTLLLFLSIPLLSFFTEKTDDILIVEENPPAMMCNPVTRWNRLTQVQKDSIMDNDTLTNVIGFHSGLEDAGNNPILMDIKVTGSANSTMPSIINRRVPGRWGLTSFYNGRSTGSESGAKYCYSFSSAVPFEINSQEHQFFNDGEHIRVTASLVGVPVVLNGGLHGSATPATLVGDGTTELHFAANQHFGVGVWWDAHSAGNDVDQVCVEYYRESNGQEFFGHEPFTLSLCNTNRVIFDDPIALSDPNAPPIFTPIRDMVKLTKEIECVAPSAIAGEVEVTFKIAMENDGSDTISNIQILDDLGEYMPAGSYLAIGNINFGAGHSMAEDPVINAPAFNGISVIDLFDGNSGKMAPGDQLIINFTITADPTVLGVYAPVANQAWVYGSDEIDRMVSAASDAPLGSPGNTGGKVDGLLMYLPAVNASMWVSAFNPNPPYDHSGNAEVTFSIKVKNTGNTKIDQLSIFHNLQNDLGIAFKNIVAAPFVIGSNFNPTSGTNPAFTGVAGNDNALTVSNIFLSTDDEMTVTIKALIDPDAPGLVLPLSTQASASARGLMPDMSALPYCLAIDLTDAGLIAESSNPGFINDSGGHDDATLISLPSIRVAQHVAGVDYATSGNFANFDVIKEIIVQNTGNVDLSTLKLIENLTAANQLGSALVNVVSAPQIVAAATNGTPNTASVNPTPNPAYNGTGDLLTGGGLLKPGEIYVVRYRIEVNPDAPGAPAILKMQAEGYGTGEGIAGADVEVSDNSDSGLNPSTSNPGRPGDSGGSNDPTPLTNCYSQIAGGISCNNSVQVSLNDTCVANLIPEMVLEGEINDCASDALLPLGGYYEVMMVNTLNGLLVPDMNPASANIYEIDGSYVGQTLVVKVKDVVYKNNCWGYITIEDKLGPVFDCPTAPVQVDCDTNFATIAPPLLIDNCDPDPTVQFVGEQVIDNDICDDGVYRIRRTYAGHDEHGNPTMNQCIIIYELIRPGVIFPKDISWHCEQYEAYPEIVDPTYLNPLVIDTDLLDSDIDAAANLGANVLQNTGSGFVANAGGHCGYNISVHDSPLTTCGNSFKIVRTWTVIDWCTGSVILVDVNGNDNVQMVKIEDKVAPVISKTPFIVNAATSGQHPFACVSNGFLPPPESISDNCDNPVNIQIITPIGAVEYVVPDGTQGGFIPTPGLPIGVYNIEYRATDACGNQNSIYVQVEIVDELTPAAICDEITDVNLSSNGYATVYAETFDDGSNDNCCIDYFQVRRMEDPCDDGHDDLVFGPSVIFCCNDVGAGPQMVVFRVYDCNGNFNDCMISATVSDKIGPQLTSCPSTQTISCDDYALDYETQLAALSGDATAQNELFDAEFGTPNFFDNCGFSVSKDIDIDLTQCLEGTITRSWFATDPEGVASQTCTQQINVFHQSDWVVEFPADTSITCGNALPPFGEPTIFNESCEMIAITYDDDTLTIVQDACFKIVRTWAVINWCVVGDEVDQEVIEASEEDLGLGFPACDLDNDGDCDDRTFRDSWNASFMPNNSMANQSFVPDTDPDSDPWDGYIIYAQKIKVEDTTDPQFNAGCDIPNVCINDSLTCSATFSIPDLVATIDDCSNLTSFNITTDIPNGSGTGPFVNVPPGTYNVTYAVTDNCNNQASCSTMVTVEDCKAPTVFCKDGFIAVVMETLPPMIMVNAAQLDDGSFDNCSNVTFSFSSDTLDIDSTFFCDNIPGDSVEIWVTDEAGNQDFCVTFIQIQGDSACLDDPSVVHIGGVIDTEEGQPVEHINVSISGGSNSYFMTDPTGSFQFSDLPVGNDVTLTPVKDDDHRNGVTTYDLVKISQHILGILPLDSPYKMIAADANRSGAITTFDLVEIRKLILYITDEFPSNTSWRFVPKDYVFPNLHNPWATAFPEVININNVPDDVLDADFIAIKTGDVNGSAQTNIHDDLEDRSTTGSLMFFSENKTWEAGEEIVLELSTEDFEAVGFQFTLNFDPALLSFQEVLPSLTDAGHFGMQFLEEGVLTVSWNDYQSTWLEGQNIIELAFVARKAGSFSQSIQLNSRYTLAEAYNVEGEFLGVELAFSENPDAGFELLQNVPNPFSESTTIGFRLGRATHATLSITDISGRIVQTYTGSFQDGYNEIIIQRKDLPSSGIYYYRLDTPDHTATKMMIMVN